MHVFQSGQRVHLVDKKGRQYALTLKAGDRFQHSGDFLPHDDLIGRPDGSTVCLSGGKIMVALRPTLAEYILKMPRGAQVLYPKDIAMILMWADVYPGARVFEAGVGSAALTLGLLRAVGDRGAVVSYETREDFARTAMKNIERCLGPVDNFRLEMRDAGDGIGTDTDAGVNVGINADTDTGTGINGATATGTTAATGTDAGINADTGTGTGINGDTDTSTTTAALFDRVILDLPEPWRVIPHVPAALRSGGIYLSFVPTVPQVVQTVDELRRTRAFGMIETFETLMRHWNIAGRSVRPDLRMIAHSGFITVARRIDTGGAAWPEHGTSEAAHD